MILKKEDVIKHNKHILAVSGGDFGLVNDNLSFTVDSVNQEKNLLDKSTNFLYYTIAGHPFIEGNKRTAFEIAKGILASGGSLLKAREEEIIGFITGSLAQDKVSKEETRNWLSE